MDDIALSPTPLVLEVAGLSAIKRFISQALPKSCEEYLAEAYITELKSLVFGCEADALSSAFPEVSWCQEGKPTKAASK